MKTYRVDANVVLRFLTGQPEEMAETSRRIMEQADQGAFRLFLSLLIIAEIYWVLHSYYEFSRDRIREVLSKLVRASGIDVSNASLVEEALNLSADQDVDFVDAVLALQAKESEQPVITFGRSDFQSLPADWKQPEEIN